jgi:hypothetical protein
MSARPGRIKEIVDTSRFNNRTANLTQQPDFNAAVDHIWGLVRDEAKEIRAKEMRRA